LILFGSFDCDTIVNNDECPRAAVGAVHDQPNGVCHFIADAGLVYDQTDFRRMVQDIRPAVELDGNWWCQHWSLDRTDKLNIGMVISWHSNKRARIGFPCVIVL
jgi:hypothetical protein